MRALVTGAGGFLGGAVARHLVGRGVQVRSLQRGSYPQLAALGVEQLRGDLADPAQVRAAVEGCDAVFHVAGRVGIWGTYEDYYRANVLGTQNIIDACRASGVRKLVFTSSPSVVFDGTDMEGVNESCPYPDHYLAYYPQTKAAAEQLVMAANGPELATVSLRPHLIWGPGDNHIVPRIVRRARAGRLVRIGNKPCRVDTVYIDNAAEAHLLALDALDIGSKVAGKTYFISNDEPLPLWEVVTRILDAAGVPPVNRSVSETLATVAATVLEGAWRTFSLSGEPPLTRFMAKELSTAHWFDISAAKRDFGYTPRVSIDQGFEHLAAWLRENPSVLSEQH